ncbi:MAG: hypothetical protein ACHQNA_09650, partial [Acidimicrobiales bacterium]
GSPASTVLVLSSAGSGGPTVTGMLVAPNPANGSADVALQATGTDSATSNLYVTGAEFFIDPVGTPAPGSGTPIAIATPAPDVSLNATIPAATIGALADGQHSVTVQAQDSLGTWGPLSAVTLTVDKTGPGTSGVVANPNPTNGAFGVQIGSTGTFSELITANVADPITGGVNSNIVAAEFFVDGTTGTRVNGTGGAMLPTAGAFGGTSAGVYGTIDLYTMGQFGTGNHTIYVHGQDAAGNWGPTATTVLVVDKTRPFITAASLAPNPTNGAASVVLNVTVLDPNYINRIEYFIDNPTPTLGTGTSITATPALPATSVTGTANINVGSLAIGTHTVSVYARNTIGNWSPATTLSLTVTSFADGFESGNTSAWSSRSTTSATRLSVTTAAALVGTYGLQVQGNNTNYVQRNFTAATTTSVLDARFYFRPNANASAGSDIFAAGSSSTNFGTTRFRVRYRLSGGTPQVQIQVGTGNANTTWTPILGGTSSNVIEVVWQSGTSLQLYVNGVLSQTLAAGAGSVGSIRLGSVTSGGSPIRMYFDAFVSKRTASPLIGP